MIPSLSYDDGSDLEPEMDMHAASSFPRTHSYEENETFLFTDMFRFP